MKMEGKNCSEDRGKIRKGGGGRKEGGGKGEGREGRKECKRRKEGGQVAQL